MKNVITVALCAVLALCASSSDYILFDRHSWPGKPSVFKGAKMVGDYAQTRGLYAKFVQDGSGIQIRTPTGDRPADVSAWFESDVDVTVEFLAMKAAAPDRVMVELLVMDRLADPMEKRSVKSETVETASAEKMSADRRRLRFRLQKPEGLTSSFNPEQVKIIARGKGALAVTRIVASGARVTPNRLPVPPAGRDEHLWLSVKGRHIVTSPLAAGGEKPFVAVGVGYGKNVILRGFDDLVAEYCKRMGMNTIRLAFYNQYFNSRAAEPLAFEDVTAFIDPVVAAARRHGLYVILDDHGYFKDEIDEETARGEQKSAGWTKARFEDWVRCWARVAERYKNEPRILGYELCNEPVCDPEVARKWYKRAIDAIRRHDQRHIVILGSHHWSHSRALEATWYDLADKIDAPYNKAVFAFHDYPMDDDPWKVQKVLADFQDKYNVPVMCTEFGGGGTPERVHREAQAGMLALFAKEGISWMIWTIQDRPDLGCGYPTRAAKINRKWEPLPPPVERYWIPYPEIWAPHARIVASPMPVRGK